MDPRPLPVLRGKKNWPLRGKKLAPVLPLGEGERRGCAPGEAAGLNRNALLVYADGYGKCQ